MADNQVNTQAAPDDKKSVGFGILSFFFPVVGLILFIVWRQQYPLKAKSAGIGAIIGAALEIVIGILYALVFASIFAGALAAAGAVQ
jgi:hypothetical protein